VGPARLGEPHRAVRPEEAQALLGEKAMAKLEARFHPPDRRAGTYIVVGHVTWPDPPVVAAPLIQAAPSLALTSAPATLLATLRHLVRANLRSLANLESIQNEYWSFVRL
jgi:hypothetical protein